MKVTVFSSKEFEIASLQKANNNAHELIFVKQALSIESVELAKSSDAICVFPNDDASAPVLEKLQQMKITHIANRAAGYDHIDLDKAAELNFRVANVPEYSPYAIAEHAVALMMALNRKIVLADQQVKRFDFALDNLIGFDFNGKTIGIIGTGKTGRIVARIMMGFGCKILAYDIEENKELSKSGVRYCNLDELCSASDIISLHAPLNSHTKYMIDKDRLASMKKGVMIINTARGPLLNTAHVLEALKSGHIGHLGLDVYEKEKGLFFYDHSKETLQDDLFARLLTFKNVLITGHQAFLTETALRNIADTTIYNLNCWQKGEQSKFELVSKKAIA